MRIASQQRLGNLSSRSQLVIITGEMSENMSFGNWADFTPENIKTYSEDKLLLAQKLNQGGIYDTWAREELARRRMLALHDATKMVSDAVAVLTNSSTQLQGLTTNLVDETTKVHREVALLTDSSERLERLTMVLRNLTWVLIILAVLSGLVPVGIEIWKAHQDSAIAPR